MGHSAAELDPAGMAKHESLEQRKQKLRDLLRDRVLGEFTVGEAGSLMRLLGVPGGHSWESGPNERDLQILEAKARNLGLM